MGELEWSFFPIVGFIVCFTHQCSKHIQTRLVTVLGLRVMVLGVCFKFQEMMNSLFCKDDVQSTNLCCNMFYVFFVKSCLVGTGNDNMFFHVCCRLTRLMSRLARGLIWTTVFFRKLNAGFCNIHVLQRSHWESGATHNYLDLDVLTILSVYSNHIPGFYENCGMPLAPDVPLGWCDCSPPHWGLHLQFSDVPTLWTIFSTNSMHHYLPMLLN